MSQDNVWEMGTKEGECHPRRKEWHIQRQREDGMTGELQVVWYS